MIRYAALSDGEFADKFADGAFASQEKLQNVKPRRVTECAKIFCDQSRGRLRALGIRSARYY